MPKISWTIKGDRRGERDIYNHRARGKNPDALRAAYVSVRERGTIFLRVSRDKTTAQTGDATDLPPTRAAANSGVLHLSIRLVVLPIAEQRDRRVPLVVDDVYVVSRRQRGPCEMLQSSLIPRWELPRGRSHSPPSAPRGRRGRRRRRRLARVRHTATYAADDSSLLFQASRGSGPAVESTSASRWTLSRAIVQSPAEIISASARLTDCRWTPRDFREWCNSKRWKSIR